ncbi:DUF5681 domain-containing protein [Sphingomonas sp. Y38-1Y]|uniref:DUF5681 domain-containing protein n=1 Tax=Sphingomonas sp. Y38-1Y TaxID=3078265 RepID=UPI0028E89B80|nr:DUF5681 domain-containing protein [Sphingomonas sp. Y38-1Y]
MSDRNDDEARPQRGKDGRFMPGSSGNRRGRPAKRRRLMVPSQILRDITEIADQEITVDGPSGPRTITKGELLLERIFALAAKGNPTAINFWMKWWPLALEERMRRHPELGNAEMFRMLHESPTGTADPAFRTAVDVWVKRIKRL